MAEESGSRTHQARLTPLTGFEVRAPQPGCDPLPKNIRIALTDVAIAFTIKKK